MPGKTHRPAARRRRRRRGQRRPSATEQRDWAGLPWDILTLIFRKIGGIEVLWRAQAVCHQWRQLAMDPLFWRIIDMGKHSDLFNQIDMEVLARMAVDRCGGVVEELYLDYSARRPQPAADRRDPLLNYVTDRTTRLKRVVLISVYHLWDEALVEFVTGCPLLEELQITNCSFGEGVYESVGLARPELKCFRLNGDSTEDYIEPDEVAIEIADGMPHLRELQLIGNPMTNNGLHAILDKCLQLESLDIRACLNVNVDAYLSKKLAKIEKVKLPNDSTDDYEFLTRDDDVISGEHCFSAYPEYDLAYGDYGTNFCYDDFTVADYFDDCGTNFCYDDFTVADYFDDYGTSFWY